MATSVPYEEGHLLQQIAAGNERSFAQLVDHHWSKIYSMAVAYLKSSTLAQDLVQEVFLTVWQKREGLPDLRSFDAWLFIIARNALLGALRRNRQLYTSSDHFFADLVEPVQSPDRQYDFKQLKQLLKAGIEQLPPQQRLIFQLSHEQGLSHEQICEQLGLARQTVKNHLVRAMITLRTYLQSKGDLFIVLLINIIINL